MFYKQHVLVAFVVCFVHNVLATSEGHRLWEHLFSNSTYNRDVRPVKDWSTPTVVNISIAVIAVVDFNEVKQTIVLTSKFTLAWRDEYLTWDPNEYGNMSHIHVSQERIWKPYIFLENSVSKQTELGTNSLQVIVTSEGDVQWHPVEVFQSTCAADVRQFPFDTQKCSMVFETFGYAGNELQMNSIEDHIAFHGSGSTSGWSVIETSIGAIDEDGEMHIECSLTLRRDPTYFILNIFLPIVVLSFLNICVFILPVQSGEKASFVITVFLSLAVFLTIVSSNLPENSDSVSILNVYVFMSTLLSVIIAILTIIQIRIFHRDPRIPVSAWLSKMAHAFTSNPQAAETKEEKSKCNDHADGKKMSITHVMPFEQDGGKEKVAFLDKRQNSVQSPFLKEATWPQVVKAFDNIFLVVFLSVNILMTTVIFILAVKRDPAEEYEGH